MSRRSFFPSARIPAREEARTLDLAGISFSYTLYRSARRTLGIRIGPRGARVDAPLACSLAEIEAGLMQHSDWIVKKLAEQRQRPPAAPLAEGSRISWLGKPVTLRRAAPEARRGHFDAERGELFLYAPEGRSLEAALVSWMRARARPLLLERLRMFAERRGIATPPLILSSASTRWGSCNAKGEIRLSWRLLQFDLDLVDYVVAHELAHLEEMNHSPRFWAAVERLYPDWRRARAEIRRAGSGGV